MRHIVFSLVAGAALLASVGAATAKDPVKLDKATAGAAANETAFLVGISQTNLSSLQAFSNFALGLLNGVPQPLPGLTASDGTLDCIASCAA